MFNKQRHRNADSELSNFVHQPLLLVCLALLLDNGRLGLGAVYGKQVPAVFSHLSFFCRLVFAPSLLSAYTTLIGAFLGAPWLRYVGGAAAVFFAMYGLNNYVTNVVGKLQYTEKDGVSTYTCDLQQVTGGLTDKQGGLQ